MEFADGLAKCLSQIPRGRVATCGAIARALGDVRAARAVATWITDHPDTSGGHRVVRADGRPILRDAAKVLRGEGAVLRRGRAVQTRTLNRLKPIEFFANLRAEQRRLERAVVERDDLSVVRQIAGVDISYRGDRMFAAAVSFSIDDREVTEIAVVGGHVAFPYVPTYLAYRELPGVEAAVRRLSARPDVLLIDGHGRLHPTLFGIACQAGIRLDLPTIGVAKHPLVGHVRPDRTRDVAVPVDIDGVERGLAWTPPGRSRPIYISVGNRISLQGAFEVVRRSTNRTYPEPLKIADRVSREMRWNEKREKGARR